MQVEIRKGAHGGTALAHLVGRGHQRFVIHAGLADLKAIEHQAEGSAGHFCGFRIVESADISPIVAVIEFEAFGPAQNVGRAGEAHFDHYEGALRALADVHVGDIATDFAVIQLDAVVEIILRRGITRHKIDDNALGAGGHGAFDRTCDGIGAGFPGGQGSRCNAEDGFVEDSGLRGAIGARNKDVRATQIPDTRRLLAVVSLITHFDFDIFLPFQGAGVGIGNDDGDLAAGIDIE